MPDVDINKKWPLVGYSYDWTSTAAVNIQKVLLRPNNATVLSPFLLPAHSSALRFQDIDRSLLDFTYVGVLSFSARVVGEVGRRNKKEVDRQSYIWTAGFQVELYSMGWNRSTGRDVSQSQFRRRGAVGLDVEDPAQEATE